MGKCAEVIAIGDEITSGQRLDTNSQWLSNQLADCGIVTLFHSTVGDDFDACVRVFREAIDRADVVVMTGGLGPTQDDLTRRALAVAAGLEIEIREEAIAHIESLFARRGRTMPERNRLQAEFPVGSRIIHNPQGTAPGIDLDVPRDGRDPSRLFCFPGVPAEMKQMWQESVRSLVSPENQAARFVKHAVVKCFGLGESDMEARIPELIARDHVPRVGITVNRATISLRISADAESESECDQQIDDVKRKLGERVGELIYGEGDDFELQHCIADLLEQRGESLCCFEAGYASEADSALSSLERDDVYRGGLSLTNTDHVTDWHASLGASGSGAHGDFPIRLMESFAADWILVIDGYPSLTPVDGQPLPSSDVNLIVAGRTLAEPRRLKIHLGGHPDVLAPRIAKSGLDFLRKVLLKHST